MSGLLNLEMNYEISSRESIQDECMDGKEKQESLKDDIFIAYETNNSIDRSVRNAIFIDFETNKGNLAPLGARYL